jgi:hypothetical protein
LPRSVPSRLPAPPASAPPLDEGQQALLVLLDRLERLGWDFVTPTPTTHRLLLGRDQRPARDLRDWLGWSRAGRLADLDPDIRDLLARADAFEETPQGWKSRLRVSRIGGGLFLHSAYPTTDRDAVFLGPDTYRFVRFLEARLPAGARRIVDVGAGAGVGGVFAGRRLAGARVQLTDVNPEALRLAVVNAAHAGVAVEPIEAPGLDAVEPGVDLAVANPPFMAGRGRTYSAGGDLHGARLSIDWAETALERLRPGGRLLMYTGSAILEGGRDRLREQLVRVAGRAADLDYAELDPDIFGGVLGGPAYAGVERIAAVGVTLVKR